MTIQLIDQDHHNTHMWLNDIQEQCQFDSKNDALAALRVVLQDLRDNLRLEMLAHLSAELPVFIRGLLFEGWRPSDDLLKERTEGVFLASIETRLKNLGYTTITAEQAARGVFQAMQKFIDADQTQKIESILPRGLLAFWKS